MKHFEKDSLDHSNIMCHNIRFRRQVNAIAPCPFYHVLHKTPASLSSSINEGCDLCILIRAQLGATEVESDLLEELKAYVVLSLRILDEEGEALGFGPSPWSIDIISSLGNAPLEVIDKIPDSYRNALDKRVDRFSASALDMPNPCPSARLNIGLINIWKLQCISNHRSCRLGYPTTVIKQLPCRLINVEDPDRPFLIETHANMQADYVALSYCWGPHEQTQTLRKNIATHLTNIPISTLSNTCKDAVSVAHLLGYKYLWIDALCIIQDDEDDKGLEISRMGHIYRHADLTICAEGSPGAHAGLFPKTLPDPRELYPCQVKISAEAPDRTITRDLTVAGTRNGENYLSRRGWTLQEEILTSRALVIGHGMASWRCTSGIAHETDPVLKPLPLNPYSKDLEYDIPRSMGSSLNVARLRMWLYAPSAARQMASRRHPTAKYPAFLAWYTLIENYSDRDLTVTTDTLPAVQGIASVLKSSLAASYRSGLWAEDLVRGLLWYVAGNDDRSVSSQSADSNLAPKVPSWSWAAVGKVRVRFGALRFVADWTCTDLADLSLDPSSDLTAPEGGQLLAKGPTLRALLATDQAFTKRRTSTGYMSCTDCSDRYGPAGLMTEGVFPRFPALLLDPGHTGNAIGEALLDSPPSNEQQQSSSAHNRDKQVVCLALQKWQSNGRQCWACLLLEPAPSRNVYYRRAGVGLLLIGLAATGRFATSAFMVQRRRATVEDTSNSASASCRDRLRLAAALGVIAAAVGVAKDTSNCVLSSGRSSLGSFPSYHEVRHRLRGAAALRVIAGTVAVF
ncbi:heterokaryon incompatibility protein-domain-containing protein [Apiospora arundinis]|uniref:Heterokaryon incompatibility protein-domain-containing protein n=1 Tax=Apiospora arundinis TaxID=335852 RepID=A0ABR2IWD4_9PEZI